MIIKGTESKNNTKITKKIFLESEEDLYKLSDKDIENAKAYEFGGKYFEDVILKAVYEHEKFDSFTPPQNSSSKTNGHSKKNKSKEFIVDKIIFQMQYQTNFGENLSVLGSISELGEWNQSGALRMNWNEGHVWKGIIEYRPEFIVSIEYKYIFLKDGEVKQWEDGNNRKFSWKEIKEMFEPLVKRGNRNTVFEAHKKSEKYIYDSDNHTLTIDCRWNEKD